jgi:hypothetical protein
MSTKFEIRYYVEPRDPDISGKYDTTIKQLVNATVFPVLEILPFPGTNSVLVRLGTNTPYTAASNLALFPWNSDSVVEDLCTAQAWDPEATFEILGENPPIPS